MPCDKVGSIIRATCTVPGKKERLVDWENVYASRSCWRIMVMRSKVSVLFESISHSLKIPFPVYDVSSRVYGAPGAPPKICARTFPKSQIAEIANRRNRKSPKSQIAKIVSLRSLRYISVTESQGCFAILENIPFSVERTQGNLPDRLPIDLMIIRS